MVSLRSDAPVEPLAASLRALVGDPRYNSLIRVQLKFEVEPDLKPIQVRHVLAIVQECLSNAIRHAHARHITISVCEDVAGFLLRVADDGQGFDEKTALVGFGLRAMRDRARLLGSQLHVESHPGKGTTISIIIPEESTNNP
jgi:signal transduction histidine kinase